MSHAINGCDTAKLDTASDLMICLDLDLTLQFCLNYIIVIHAMNCCGTALVDTASALMIFLDSDVTLQFFKNLS